MTWSLSLHSRRRRSIGRPRFTSWMRATTRRAPRRRQLGGRPLLQLLVPHLRLLLPQLLPRLNQQAPWPPTPAVRRPLHSLAPLPTWTTSAHSSRTTFRRSSRLPSPSRWQRWGPPLQRRRRRRQHREQQTVRQLESRELQGCRGRHLQRAPGLPACPHWPPRHRQRHLRQRKRAGSFATRAARLRGTSRASSSTC